MENGLGLALLTYSFLALPLMLVIRFLFWLTIKQLIRFF